MSPEAGAVLIREIAPRLRSAIPQCVRAVGCEDHEELYQDGLAMAAHMLHCLEERGKSVTPGNVAFYTLLHLKSGRRSHGSGRTDTMASTTQLDHRSMVLSLEEEVGYDPELDEAIHLGDVLTCEKDDPSMAAGRNRDWEEFLESHDYRYGVVVSDLASGRTMIESAKTCGMTYHGIREVRGQLAEDLQEFMGSTVIADSVKIPGWRGNIMADKERMACRADRRRG